MPAAKPLDEKAVRNIVKEEIKAELKNFYLNLIMPNFVTKFEFEELKTEVHQIKTTQSSMMNTLDEMYGLMKEMKQEMVVANNRVYKIQDPKIENHEKRITRLEASLA